jgi:hypothetical protein
MLARPLRGAAVLLVLGVAMLGAPAIALARWTRVVDDTFASGDMPAHWLEYDGPYGSDPHNCADPTHAFVWGGSLHLLMHHEDSGACGAAWYTGGVQVARAFGGVDQQVTLRWRILSYGVSSHHVIPMRFPDTGTWPAAGEEDYCEGAGPLACTTFLHYGDLAPGDQLMHGYDLGFGLESWHTMRFQRRHHTVKAWIDDLTTPVWTYTGDAATLPDTVKRVVLQQECRAGGCPSGTTGAEDIQIDWIRIADPSA